MRIMMMKSRVGLIPEKKTIQRNGRTFITTIWVRKDKSINNHEKSSNVQIDEIKKRYFGTEKWMKAPNGSPTKLTEKQWLQVRTPSFKEWFGDWDSDPKNASKVVDENGEPLVVYHGTKEEFDEYSKKYLGKNSGNGTWTEWGFFFSEDKNHAEYWSNYRSGGEGKILDLFLNIKNPLIVDLNEDQYGDTIDRKLPDSDYDGVKIENMFEDDRHELTSWLAIEPKQIKSATDNIGSFNKDENNMKKGGIKVVIKKSINNDEKLDYFKKIILDHLSTLKEDDTEDEGTIKKALSRMILMIKSGLPVGTIHTYKNGKKYIKAPSGKWIPKYDSHTRGAKMAVSAIKRKISDAQDANSMMQIVLDNRDRFSDAHGQPLPFVQELSEYVRSRGETIDRSNDTARSLLSGRKGKIPESSIKPKVKETPENNKKDEPKNETIPGNDKKQRLGYASKALDRSKKNGLNPEKDIPLTDEEIEGLRTYAGLQAKRREAFKKYRDFEIWYYREAGKNQGMQSNEEHERFKKEYPILKEQLHVAEKEENKMEKYSLIDLLNKYVPEEKQKDGHYAYLETIMLGKDSPKEKTPDKNKLSDSEIKTAQEGYKRDAENASDQAIKNVIESFNKPEKQKEKYSPREWEEAQIQLSAFESESKKRGISEKNEPDAVKVGNDDSQDSIDFQELKRKYQNGPSAEGNDDEIYIGNEAMKGKWKLVEAEAPSASHDEGTFNKTRGFPKNKDGSTINDRDYEHDKSAQESVRSIAGGFDGRALSFDSPIVVTEDGIVVSGNNRTMSSKIAAREGTDTKYIDALKKRAERFGFKPADIEKFKNPRIVFETPATGEYSTQDFAKYNQSSKKQMGPVDAAVKVSKLIKEDTVKSIAEKIADFDTLGELYADKSACTNIFNTLQQSGIITQFDRPQYITDETITGAGKEFLETVLIGSVVNEANIRGLNREGCKHIRQKLVRAITPLVNNKSYGGFSVIDELNTAIDICIQVNLQKDKFPTVDVFAKQNNMFEENSEVGIELAKKMQGTQKEFADFMQNMNASLEMGANGQSDIFIGDVETKDQVLSRMLNLKKSIGNVIAFFRGLQEGKGRFVKKSVPVQGKNGETEFSERWVQESIEKSLTYSGYPLQGRTKIHGMDISIENKEGSTRSGTDKDGHDWSIKMSYDYGYIRGTVGKDKDHLDAYIGPNPDSETVFIVHQNDPSTGEYDEDKVMLGFDSLDAAKDAYLSQYDRPGFLGEIDTMDIETFKDKAFDPKNKGKRLI